MSRAAQPDFHPDAESLNAFVEHLLPDPEHRQILAHAAHCSRCRQVLYLAQLAAQEEPSPAFEPAPRTFQQFWLRLFAFRLSHWRFAAAAAAASIALVALSILLFPKHTPPSQQPAPQETAKSTPQPATTSTNSALNPSADSAPSLASKPPLPQAASRPAPLPRAVQPNPSPQPQTAFAPSDSGATVVASPAKAPPARPSAGVTHPESAVTVNAATTLVETPAPSPESYAAIGSVSESVTVEPIESAKSIQPPIDGLHGAVNNQQTAPAPNSNSSQFQLDQKAPVTAIQAEPADALHFAKSRTKSSADTHNSLATASGGARTPSTPAAFGKMTASAPDRPSPTYALSNTDAIAARNALHARLPNGSVAISTAAAQHRLLAVDAAGALFLSNDSGKTWESVPRQWTGQAVEVRLAATGDRLIAPASPEPPATAGAAANTAVLPPAPPALFEIVNDSAAVFASADGKTWKAK